HIGRGALSNLPDLPRGLRVPAGAGFGRGQLLFHLSGGVCMTGNATRSGRSSFELAQIEAGVSDSRFRARAAGRRRDLCAAARRASRGYQRPVVGIVEGQIVIVIGRSGIGVPGAAGAYIEQLLAGAEHDRSGITHGEADRTINCESRREDYGYQVVTAASE